MKCRSALCLIAAIAIACSARPPDGISEAGSVSSAADSRTTHPRVAGYYTPESTRVQLCYERFGTAERGSVVLLSGSDSQAIFWPLDFVVAIVDRGYEVIRYDGRDVGLSEWLPFPDGFDPEGWSPARPPPYELNAHVDELWGLLDGIENQRAHLVGVSQGGMVAQLAAIAEPDRVLTLVLLSSSPSNPYDESLGGVEPELLEYLIAQFPRVGLAASLPFLLGGYRVVDLQTALLVEITGVRADDRDSLRDHVQQSYHRAGLNGASSQGFAIASAKSRLDQLARIGVPTLIIHERDDRFIKPGHATALADAIPGARLIWADGGHGFPFRMYAAHTGAIVENFDLAAPGAR